MRVNIYSAVFVLMLIVSCGIVEPPEEPMFISEDRYPSWSPDGLFIAYTKLATVPSQYHSSSGIYILDLSGGEDTHIIDGLALFPEWSSDGKSLLFSRDSLGRYSFDDKSIKWIFPHESYNPSISLQSGCIAFDTPYKDKNGANAIWVMDFDGQTLIDISIHGKGEWRDPSWDPTGEKIVHYRYTENSYPAIYIMDSEGKNEKQLTNNNSWNTDPVWSPDGNKIVWSKSEEIWIMDSDGSNKIMITEGTEPDWSPDGDKLLFVNQVRDKKCLFIIDLSTDEIKKITS